MAILTDDPRQMDLFGDRRMTLKEQGRLAAQEFETHCVIADMLRVGIKPGWYWFHVPNGERRDKQAAARLKRMGTRAGIFDLIFVSPRGQLHCLEIKPKKGGRLSDAQGLFQAEMKVRGVPVEVAHGFDEAMDVLKEWDAIRVRL